MDDYSDIIDLQRPVSKRHHPMSMHDRAAQFAPFAALSGYEEAVRETARLTDTRPEPDDDDAARLNEAIIKLRDRLDERPRIRISCFFPDDLKEGGSVLSLTGNVRRIDTVNGVMIFTDGARIPLGDILDIEDAAGE